MRACTLRDHARLRAAAASDSRPHVTVILSERAPRAVAAANVLAGCDGYRRDFSRRRYGNGKRYRGLTLPMERNGSPTTISTMIAARSMPPQVKNR